MPDPLIDDNARKSRAKKLRFILYMLILLAFVLWMKHENSPLDTISPAPSEANKKRQREIDAENHRLNAAFSLVKKASALKARAEKINLYDEIITTYQNDKAVPMLRYVSWAMYKKALTATAAAEKSRLLDEVIDRYCDVSDKQVGDYVSASVRERLNLIEGGADKIAFCDSLLEKHGRRLSDSLAATLFSEKADSTPDPAGQIVIYDMMLSRFLTSADDSAFDLAIIAALDKMALIDDKAEQIRLCDLAIEAYLKTPERTRYYLFDTAVRKKAELAGDPSLPLTLYNQVIANNVTENSVVQARSMLMPFLKNDIERLAACDEFISAHQASKSDFVQLMVARAMAQKAGLLTDTEAKAALFRAVIEKCADIDDLRAKELANQIVAQLAALSGDPASAASYYDEEAATAKNEMDALLALRSKARLVKSQAEKVRLYDEIIARSGSSDDVLVSREVTETIVEKAMFIDDKGEKIKLYDEAISRSRQSRDTRERARVSDLMLDKARILDSREAKINLYDEIIARGINSGNKNELSKVTRAKYEKAKLIGELEEKTKLYDSVLLDMTRDHNNISFSFFFPNILRERVDLAAEAREKLHLYDYYIAAVGSALNPEARVSLLLDKAEITSDPSDKSLLYDEVIEQCERNLKAVDSVPAELAEFKRSIIMDHFGKAILGKADLTASVEEKLKLYDRYLAFPQVSRSGVLGINFEKMLSQKAELSGDPSIKIDYFDSQIRAAATDSQRVGWYARKAEEATGITERAAIEDEMLAKFFDNTDKDVERVIAGVLLRKIGRASDSAESSLLCDRLIQRYSGSTDSRVLYTVVRAFAFKANAADDDKTKLEIYATVIDRYKDINDFLVKDAVDDVIAAKFRLEMKGNE